MMGKISTPVIFVLVLFLAWNAQAQKPTVSAVDKTNSPVKGIITIKGSDFGTDPTKIKVFFGGADADIKSVSNQLIEAKTPAGATYDNISVSNITNGLTGYSSGQFFLNFNGQHGFTSGNFDTETDANAESGLYDLCLCDFNGDNKVDIGTASDNSNSLAIFQNGSSVASLNFTKISSLINAKSLHVTCGDLNGDGKPDMAVSEGADGDRIFVFRNTGSFTFNVQSIKITGRKVKRIAIADLDLNGKPELIVTDKGSNIISILPNQSTTSTISFGAPVNVTIPGAASTDALEIKDLNGNGLPEIVSSQFLTATSNIFICDNKSSPGVFNFSDVTTLSLSNTVVNVRAGDIDGDGKPDLVATRLLGSDISVFLNQSAATLSFASPVSILTATRPWGLDFGDLDGDGKVDIAISSITNKSITVLNNESTPGVVSFKPMVTLTTNFINRHPRIGDLDGDGKPDIAFTSIDDNNLGIPASKISVIRNKSCFVPGVTPLGPLSICSGFPLQLTSTAAGGVTFDWQKDGTSVKNSPDDFLDITSSGAYTVIASSESGTCSKASNTVNVTVSTPGAGLNATPPNAGSNSPVCTKDILNLSVSDVGATEYRWTGPNGFTATGRTPSLSNFSLNNAGLYIVEMIAGTCVAKVDSTIVEGVTNPDFTISFSGSSLVCQGSTKLLSASPVLTSGFTYQWFEKTAGAISGQTNNTFGATASGEYSLKVTSAFAGCSPVTTPSVLITGVTLPVVAFTPSATSACVGQVVTFTNQSTVDPGATTTYAWSFGDTQVSSAVSPTNTYAAAGTYPVKLKVSYQGGECPAEVTKSITIINSPTLNITNPNNANVFKICPGDTLRLGVAGDTFTSYSWNTGAVTSTILITEAKDYSVTVTNTAGCIIQVNKTVDSFPAPVVTASADPTTIKVGTNSKLLATGLESYIWRPGLSLSDSTSANPVANPLQSIVYTVSGKDVNGCKGEATVEITVTGTSALSLITPKNYFSPNGDNINPNWTIDNIESFPDCSVTVYDDKGGKVFEAKPYNNTWDGTFKGSKLPGGVYYYVIRCDGDSNVKTGSITLLK